MRMRGSIRSLGQGQRLGRVESAGRVRLSCECSSMSCMEHGAFFLFVARLHIYTTFADTRRQHSECCSRFSVSQ